MKHLMIDIETMGNESFSSIVSIGAVEFDINNGETGREFYVKIDLQSCIDEGLIMNASTVMWWLKQGEAARNELGTGEVETLRNALFKFSDFFTEDYQVWGNSARFDLGILENAYSKIGKPIPWKFWNERDVRTLVSFSPDVKETFVFNGVAHNAIDDCKFQIGYCSKIWDRLNCA